MRKKTLMLGKKRWKEAKEKEDMTTTKEYDPSKTHLNLSDLQSDVHHTHQPLQSLFFFSYLIRNNIFLFFFKQVIAQRSNHFPSKQSQALMNTRSYYPWE